MLTLLKRISRFKDKHISSKAIAIWALNRKLPSDWGSIKDLSLDHETHVLTVFITQKPEKEKQEQNTAKLIDTAIEIHHYHVDIIAGEATLSWKKIKVTGARQAWFLKKLKQHSQVVIPTVYVGLVEKLNRRKKLSAVSIPSS